MQPYFQVSPQLWNLAQFRDLNPGPSDLECSALPPGPGIPQGRSIIQELLWSIGLSTFTFCSLGSRYPCTAVDVVRMFDTSKSNINSLGRLGLTPLTVIHMLFHALRGWVGSEGVLHNTMRRVTKTPQKCVQGGAWKLVKLAWHNTWMIPYTYYCSVPRDFFMPMHFPAAKQAKKMKYSIYTIEDKKVFH